MQVEIYSSTLTAEVSGLLRQLEETYGSRVVSMATDQAPFANIGKLVISPLCKHPYVDALWKGRRSFHRPTNTYFVDIPADYLSLASPDWPSRISAYADAVSSGICRVAKTRLTSEERATLLDIVRRASSEVSAAPPPQIAMIGPIYVRSENTTDYDPILSFGPHPGMIPVMPGEIANHWPDMPLRRESLFKLYAKHDGKLHYREAWFSEDATIIEHWGICGERGDDRTHRFKTSDEAQNVFQRLKSKALEEGFRPMALGKHAKLLVEFPVAGIGSPAELKRRHELEDFLEDLVGWLGLGHLDGGSIGSGTMEAMCYVVDFTIAKAAVERALRESSFSDFSRIYRETD